MSFRLENNPCQNCKERSISCHSTCDKYLTWQKGFKAEVQRLRDKRNLESIGYNCGTWARLRKQV